MNITLNVPSTALSVPVLANRDSMGPEIYDFLFNGVVEQIYANQTILYDNQKTLLSAYESIQMMLAEVLLSDEEE